MLKCILIDDDQDEIDIFSMALTDIDVEAECEGYTSCAKATEAFAQKTVQPDCIFLDSNLSGINGMECLKKIKQMPGMETIPVIIFSGFLSDTEKLQYKELGALDCIVKGNSLTDLRSKLSSFFSENFKVQR